MKQKTLRIRFKHAAIFLLLLPVLFLLQPAAKKVHPPAPDYYTQYAYALYETGTLSSPTKNSEVHPTMTRPPLYPALLAAWMHVDTSFRNSSKCWTNAKLIDSKTLCPADYGYVHEMQIVLFWIGAVFVWLAARIIFERPALAYAAMGLYGASGQIFRYATVHRVSENLSIPLIIAASFALLLAWRQKNNWWFFLAGIIIGAAALTRPANQFLVILIPLAMLLHASASKGERKWQKTLLSISTLVIGFAIVVSPWVLRNAYHFNKAAISASDVSVLKVRYSYNQMRADEALASFVYWLPDFGDKLAPVLFPKESLHRLDITAHDGFRLTGLRLASELPAGTVINTRTMVEMILEDWPRHVVMSIPIAWRGLFPGKYLVLLMSPALIFVLLFARGRKHDDILYFAMPGVCLLIFYASVSHNIPRYGMTLMPGASLALVYAAMALRRRWLNRKFLQSSIKGPT